MAVRVHTGPLVLTSALHESKQTASFPSHTTLKVAPEQRTGWTPEQVRALPRISHNSSVIQPLAYSPYQMSIPGLLNMIYVQLDVFGTNRTTSQ